MDLVLNSAPVTWQVLLLARDLNEQNIDNE